MFYVEMLVAFVAGGAAAHVMRRRIESLFAKPVPKKVRKPRAKKIPSVVKPEGE